MINTNKSDYDRWFNCGTVYTIKDYVKWRGDLDFEIVESNEIDYLILAIIIYIQFDGIVDESKEQTISFKEAIRENERKGIQYSKARTNFEKDVLRLCSIMADTKRYGSMLLSGYLNLFDIETQKQFAVISIQITNNEKVIAFRGTDNTLVGWKEDFNMSFMENIPSQLEAKKYLNEILIQYRHKVSLVGHSKGGNLAVYAASNLAKKYAKQMKQIYNFDGPGFSSKTINLLDFTEILPKINTIVPHSSLVGMLLEHEEPYRIVESIQKNGIFQHNPFTWKLDAVYFKYQEQLSSRGTAMAKTIRYWLMQLDEEEKSMFIDYVYSVLAKTEVVIFTELLKPKNMNRVLREIGTTDKETKRMLRKTIKLFIEAGIRSNEDVLPNIIRKHMS